MEKFMKLASLFSGGKDSVYATYLVKKAGHEISCLISIQSENKESFMFHTPSINQVKKQAQSIGVPLITVKTKGEKEKELADLERAIKQAIQKYKIQGVVTGALASEYQASRIKKICDKLKIKCFNPLWGKNQIELLKELVKNKFEVVITGVFAYPLGRNFLGRKINTDFINEVKVLQEKWGINPAGEGGEFESFVLNCPLFKEKLKIKSFNDFGEENSWRREIKIK